MSSLAEASKPQLDVLAMPTDVTFPEGTELAFKFWVHNPENIKDAVDCLEQESVIAIEYFRVGPGFEAGMDAVNAVLQGNETNTQLDLVKNLVANEDVRGHIALAYPGSGKVVVPVDSWVHSNDPNHPTQRNYEIEGYDTVSADDALAKAYRLARWAYAREQITLRQLSEVATELKAAGEIPRIAVLYGAMHTPLYHSARMIGVAADREYVGEKAVSAVAVLSKMMRWSVVKDPNQPDAYRVQKTPQISRYAAASALTSSIINTLEEEALDNMMAVAAREGYTTELPPSFESETRVVRELRHNSGLFAQRLSSLDEDTQKRAQKIVNAFHNRGNTRFRKQRSIEKAKQGLLELISTD
jgi:hypothetical protein